ncbi:MAG: hypothetical protein WCL39_07250 [Armatimonadota bacterium]
MQPDTKKQIPVLIALSAVLLLAIGYSVKKSLSSGRPAAPSGTTSVQTAETGQTAEKAVTTPDSQVVASAEGASYNFVGNPPRDPFEPQLPGVTGGPAANPRFVPTNQGSKSSAHKLRSSWKPGSFGNSGGLPPLDITKLGVEPGGQTPVNGSVASAQGVPDRPAYTATGVIRGREDIAIIRGEGGSRYFVRQGQSVGDGYVVQMISPGGVVLKNKDRRVFLKVGGAQDAKSSDSAR